MLTDVIKTAVEDLENVLKTEHVVSYLIAPIETLRHASNDKKFAVQLENTYDGCTELCVCAETEDYNNNPEVARKLFKILRQLNVTLRQYR